VIVSLPEEMPVNETASLEQQMNDDVGASVDRIYMNALYPERFSDDEGARIEPLVQNGDGGNGSVRAALRAALSQSRRAEGQRKQLVRLEELTSAPVRTLPYVFEPELGLDEIRSLAEAID
jgi:hypothetical protein